MDFLCSLQQKFSDREAFIMAMKSAIENAGFNVQPGSLEDAESALQREHIKSTRLLS